MNGTVAPGLFGLVLVIGVVIGALVSPPVVQSILYYRQIAACWSPDIKAGATDLAKRTAAHIFKESLPFNLTDAQKAALVSSFDVRINGFFVMSASPQVAVIKCGAAMGYSYTTLNGRPYHHDEGNIITFTVYQSSDGPSPTMSQADLAGVPISYQPPSSQPTQ
jgi:hypothetical protein